MGHLVVASCLYHLESGLYDIRFGICYMAFNSGFLLLKLFEMGNYERLSLKK